MSVETPEQLDGLRRAGRLVAATLRALRDAVRPGVTTGELDALAEDVFATQGARSGPILTYGYPGSICVCVDDEVVHGIPGRRRLRSGQLVTLDVAAELDGYHADAAVTVAVGEASPSAERLLSATRAALVAGIRAAQPGAALHDLTGHGIGLAMHEPPTVFNWPSPLATERLTEGLVFTIEPMLGAGRAGLELDRDGWTVRTRDRSLSAHEEHTIMVAAGGPVVLTAT
jgi:methionyl aminopeptidase